MLKKYLEKRKAEKEKLHKSLEDEKRFFDGLKEYTPKATEDNILLLKKLASIVEEFCPEAAPVTDTGLELGKDLGMDSLGMMNFLLAVEEEFDTEIPYFERFTEHSTVWDVFVMLHYCIFQKEEKK